MYRRPSEKIILVTKSNNQRKIDLVKERGYKEGKNHLFSLAIFLSLAFFKGCPRTCWVLPVIDG